MEVVRLQQGQHLFLDGVLGEASTFLVLGLKVLLLFLLSHSC